MDSADINSIGLILDILGVIILFKFGLPSNINKNGSVGMAFIKKDESEIKKWKLYNFWSRFGLIIILLGFICQIVSNYFKS